MLRSGAASRARGLIGGVISMGPMLCIGLIQPVGVLADNHETVADSDTTPTRPQSKRVRTYQERYQPEEPPQGGYIVDHHAWVFNQGFADQYQMPAQWIDAELTGADALAYRVEWQTGERCGYEGDVPCRRRVKCVADVYWFKGEALPFRNDLAVNHDAQGADHSMHWLSAQSPEDHANMVEMRQSNMLAGSILAAYTGADGEALVEVNGFQYERRESRVDNISIQFPCDLVWGWKSGDLRLYVGAPGVDGEQLKAGYETPSSTKINRVVVIPSTFRSRLRAHHEEYMNLESWIYADDFRDAIWVKGDGFEKTDYETRFTEKSDQPYDKDLNVWTYTAEFAERFGMPAQWAVEDLGDAVAIAARLEESTRVHCNRLRCYRVEQCLYDIYFKADVEMDWEVDVPVNNVGGHYEDRSTNYLINRDLNQAKLHYDKFLLADYTKGRMPDGEIRHNLPIGKQKERRQRIDWVWPWFKIWGDWKLSGYVNSRQVYTYERRLAGLQVFTIEQRCPIPKYWFSARKAIIEGQVEERHNRILFFRRIKGVDSKNIVQHYRELNDKLDYQQELEQDILLEAYEPWEFIIRAKTRWAEEHKMGKIIGDTVEALSQ